jgi:spore germination protein YaaH
MKQLFTLIALVMLSYLLPAQNSQPLSIHQEELNYYNSLGLSTDDQFDALNGTYRIPQEESRAGCNLEKIVFGYHPYWNGTVYRNYRWNLLSDLCYFSYEVDTLTGNAISTHNWATADVVDTALMLGKRVHLCVTLFAGHAYFLTHATPKQTLITNLINLVQSRGASGVNIDFEGVPSSQKANLTAFLIDLCNQMHTAIPGSKVSIAAPAVNWSSTFDVAALNAYLDWFVIMGYDFYWSGSTTAGPGSGLYSMTCSTYDNLSRSLTYYLNAGAANNKLILALPYYGREWHTTASTVPSSTIAGTSSSRTYKYIHDNSSGYYNNANLHWEPNSFTPYHVFNDGTAWHQCFADNEKSLAYRYDMVYLRNIAGIGIWALGYDDTYSALWNLIEDKLTNCRVVPCSDTLYDLGGPACSHFDNENFTWTLSPDGATGLNMTFTNFDLESGYDSLWIYDGNSTTAPLLGRYSGTAGPGTVTASGGVMTLKFHSDNATTHSGWQAIWHCTQDNQIPVSTITAPLWVTHNFNADFTDTDNLAVKDRLYQVLDYDGSEWRANGNYGFFNDNFTTALHSDWTVQSGTWNINAGRLNQTDESNSNSNIFAKVAQADTGVWLYHWQMNIGGSLTNRRAGWHFFCDSAKASNRWNSYFVYFRADDNKVQIYETTNDVYSLKTNDTCVIDPNIWYDCKILYYPQTGLIRVFLNNVAVSEWTDATPLTIGRAISLRTGSCNALYDDVKVYHSRSATAAVSIGTGKEVRYQNPNPSTPACRIKSMVTDVSDLWSTAGSRDINVDWTSPLNSAWVNDGSVGDIDTSMDVTQVHANWNTASDPQSGIASYQWALGYTPGDSSVIGWTSAGTSLNAGATALNLIPETMYYVSLKALNNAGLTSVLQSSDGFYLTLLTGISEIAAIENIKVFPNPFGKNLTLSLKIKEPTNLSIVMESISGEILYSKNTMLYPGQQELSIEWPADMAAQTCILKISAGNEILKTLQLLHINQ